MKVAGALALVIASVAPHLVPCSASLSGRSHALMGARARSASKAAQRVEAASRQAQVEEAQDDSEPEDEADGDASEEEQPDLVSTVSTAGQDVAGVGGATSVESALVAGQAEKANAETQAVAGEQEKTVDLRARAQAFEGFAKLSDEAARAEADTCERQLDSQRWEFEREGDALRRELEECKHSSSTAAEAALKSALQTEASLKMQLDEVKARAQVGTAAGSQSSGSVRDVQKALEDERRKAAETEHRLLEQLEAAQNSTRSQAKLEQMLAESRAALLAAHEAEGRLKAALSNERAETAAQSLRLHEALEELEAERSKRVECEKRLEHSGSVAKEEATLQHRLDSTEKALQTARALELRAQRAFETEKTGAAQVGKHMKQALAAEGARYSEAETRLGQARLTVSKLEGVEAKDQREVDDEVGSLQRASRALSVAKATVLDLERQLASARSALHAANTTAATLKAALKDETAMSASKEKRLQHDGVLIDQLTATERNLRKTEAEQASALRTAEGELAGARKTDEFLEKELAAAQQQLANRSAASRQEEVALSEKLKGAEARVKLEKKELALSANLTSDALKENDRLRTELRNVTVEEMSGSVRVNAMQAELADFKERLARTEAELAEERDQVASSGSTANDAVEENDRLHWDLKKMTDQDVDDSSKLQAARKHVSDLETRLEQAQAEASKEKEEAAASARRASDALKETDRLLSEVHNMTVRDQEALSKRNTSHDELAQARARVSQVEEKLAVMTREAEAAAKANVERLREIRAVEAELHHARELADAEVLGMRADRGEAKDTSEAKADTAGGGVGPVVDAFAAAADERASHESFGKMLADVHGEVADLERAQELWRSEVQELRAEGGLAQAKDKQLEEQRAALSNATRDVAAKDAELNNVTQAYDAARGRAETEQKQLEVQRAQLASATHDAATKDAELKNVTQAYDAATLRAAAEQKQLEEQSAQLSNATHDLAAKDAELKNVTQAYDAATLRAAAEQKQLEEQRAQLSNATHDLAAKDAELKNVTRAYDVAQKRAQAEDGRLEEERAALSNATQAVATKAAELNKLTKAYAGVRRRLRGANDAFLVTAKHLQTLDALAKELAGQDDVKGAIQQAAEAKGLRAKLAAARAMDSKHTTELLATQRAMQGALRQAGAADATRVKLEEVSARAREGERELRKARRLLSARSFAQERSSHEKAAMWRELEESRAALRLAADQTVALHDTREELERLRAELRASHSEHHSQPAM